MTVTIGQFFAWPGWTSTIKEFIKGCDKCQRHKLTAGKRYGKLPRDNRTRSIPWNNVHVGLIGPWAVDVQLEDGTIKPFNINALTCIDSATQWPECFATRHKTSFHIAKLFDTHWLRRYRLPRKVIYDSGGEFAGLEFQELLSSIGIIIEPITVKNPQANSIIENVHLTMADMLRTESPFILDPREQWIDEVRMLLQSIAFEMRNTISMTVKHYPAQLVFNEYMIMRMKCKVDWNKITENRNLISTESNETENKKD